MIGDKARELIMEHDSGRSLNPRILLNLDIQFPKPGDNPIENRRFFYTNGFYVLKYIPVRRNLSKRKDFLLMGDIIDNRKLRVADYEELKEIAKKNERINFLLKWSNISETTFKIAKEHFNLAIPFAFNVIKYYNYIYKDEKKEKKSVFREPGLNESEKNRLLINEIAKTSAKPVEIEV